jgi:UDPglucose 6-dehydrogenase
MAGAGVQVVGFDPDEARVSRLSKGFAPLHEPGLDELIVAKSAAGQLRFTSAATDLADVDALWVTFDTPVTADDDADPQWVIDQTARVMKHLRPGVLIIVSSQLPVGSVRKLRELRGGGPVVCVPENLRLGKGIETFTKPDRIIVGVDTPEDRVAAEAVLGTITSRLEFMSIESAEMTKHAINAFLATSVTFINELATICEKVGADASEVERGLKTEVRIGPRAYLRAGAAFAGGTLARDVRFLRLRGAELGLKTHLFDAVEISNREHAQWARRKILELTPKLSGATIAILGLTYKSDTDTLRGSPSLEAAKWLAAQGAIVRVFDPLITSPPEGFGERLNLCGSMNDALTGASVIWLAVESPAFLALAAADALSVAAPSPAILDPAGAMAKALSGRTDLRYFAVGRSR